MAEPSKHINYSFEDIQRYLQGKMPAAEMHDMERAALQDPFLADAIEGFNNADLQIAGQHLNEINASLFAEKQKTKVVAFNKRTQWVNIAALVIVLAGIALVTTYFLRSSAPVAQNEMAQVKNIDTNNTAAQKPQLEQLNASAALADSVSLAQNNISKKTESSNNQHQTKKYKNKENEVVRAKPENGDIATVAAAPPPVANATSTFTDTIGTVFTDDRAEAAKTMMVRAYPVVNTPDTVATMQTPLQGKVSGLSILPASFTGRVIDENNKPIAGVTVTSNDKRAAVLTDMNGYFNLQKTDTLLNVTASTVGYDSRSLALRRGYNSPIVLQQNHDALNDVVVVGYGTKRKKTVFATDSVLRSQTKMESDSAMPVGGWGNFNNYVLTQLNKDTTETRVINPNDLVELEFLIDNSGNPYDIHVNRSPNETQSAKAVEILKKGPKWTKPSRKKKAKVVINF